MIRTTFLFVTLTAAALAQGAGRTAASFVPGDHRCEVVIDFAALRDTGLIDDLQASMMGMMLKQAEKEMGVPFAALERIRLYPELPDSESDSQQGGIAIIEGNDKMSMPDKAGKETAKIGDYEVVLDSASDDPDLWVDVGPGLLVYGTRHVVAPLLDGSKKAGPTNAELAALGGGDGVLFKAAMFLSPAMFGGANPMEEMGIDLPETGAVRLVSETVDDEDTFVLEVVARFADAEKGPEAMVQMAMAQLQGMAAHPMMGEQLKPMMEKLDIKAQGNDAVARLKLGTSRELVTALSGLAPMMMMGGAAPGTGPGRGR